jgi:hypothetical protein
MQIDRAFGYSLLIGLITLAGCSKHENAPSQNTAAPVDQPSAVAEVAPSTEAPVTAAEASSATEEDPELAAKREAMNFALMEDEIKNDPKGQWATSAKASSTYATNLTDLSASYHFMRATGVPDTEGYGDRYTAWASKETDSGIEWLDLQFDKPVNATQVKIRQTYNPGAIIKIELFDEKNVAHSIFQGPDMTKYKPSSIGWLNAAFDKTTYKTQRVKITLATNTVPGWNEIDAVQLLGE